MKPKCEDTKVQEQYIGKCLYCNKINEVPLSAKIDTMPKHCMNCGQPIIYQRKGE